MAKKLLAIISIPLVIIHLFIVYFWVFNWRKLVTKVGLMSWIGTIFCGAIICLLYRNFVITEKVILVGKRIVFITTFITVILGVLTLLIEFITSSMP